MARVGIADVFEDGGQGFGGVEIVVQRFVESLGGGLRCGLASVSLVPSANFAVSRRSL